ncbi:peptide/nickel transport system substrate-binding protein [Thermocatellispora tengchongensis]|uniref:Peptide/nickel transport system substrate-binding protein n=1 Tax=Thermocatellispora tengchongensis TaxID=1073253 RepID=A0A840PH42_9ACTN|nr:ABC transporter substrate-binding protein [Thermocatellispora tengchongensis]MBB5136840.1 peptide/nickel transport system substrate-binding protein [Thermocatellispora tengchongensis]
MIVAGALLLAVAACGGAGPEAGSGRTGGGVDRGGSVTVLAAVGEMPGFDPVKLANVGTGIERAAMVMDTLLYRDDITGEVRPKLAESMTSADGRVWVLKLRRGVMFSDGTPLDAEAVVFNVKRHTAPESTSVAKPLLADLKSVEATGDLEVTFTLKDVNGSFPVIFTASTPASLVGSPKALADPGNFNEHPVGAGAFVLQSWTRDSEMVFAKNPEYWETGKPYLDRVTYQVMTGTQTITDTMLSGAAHSALVNAGVWPQYKGNESIKLWPPLGGGAAVVPNGSRPIGADERVRRAISLAFDPQTTKKVIMGDTDVWDGSLDCVPFAPGSPVCSPEDTPRQDLGQAKALIAEFVADGGDPDVELKYFQSLTTQATYLQSELKKIGLNVKVTAVDAATLAEIGANGDYDLIWGSTASSGYPTFWSRFYSKATNWPKATYPELDAALLKARNSLTLDERNAAWREVLNIIRDKAIAAYVLPYTASMATTTKLHLDTGGYKYTGSTMQYFDSAWLEK